MYTTFEVRSGRHTVARKQASCAQEALIDYVRGLGCRDDEIVRLGADAVCWRGAIFRAEQTGEQEDSWRASRSEARSGLAASAETVGSVGL